MSVFTLNSASLEVSWRWWASQMDFFFFFFFKLPWLCVDEDPLPAPVSCPPSLSFLPVFFSLVPLPCGLCPPAPLSLTPLVPVPQHSSLGSSCPACPRGGEGEIGPRGCTIREVLPVARWNKPKLRGTEEVLDTGQDFKTFMYCIWEEYFGAGQCCALWWCRACCGTMYYGVLG